MEKACPVLSNVHIGAYTRVMAQWREVGVRLDEFPSHQGVADEAGKAVALCG